MKALDAADAAIHMIWHVLTDMQGWREMDSLAVLITLSGGFSVGFILFVTGSADLPTTIIVALIATTTLLVATLISQKRGDDD